MNNSRITWRLGSATAIACVSIVLLVGNSSAATITGQTESIHLGASGRGPVSLHSAPAKTVQVCTPHQLAVTAWTQATVYKSHQEIYFRIAVKNAGSTTCHVGGCPPSIVVWNASGTRVWDSIPPGAAMCILIHNRLTPGESLHATLSWDQRANVGCVSPDCGFVPAGSYTARGEAGGDQSHRITFKIH